MCIELGKIHMKLQYITLNSPHFEWSRASVQHRTLSMALNQFPGVAVTKHHKLDGLKQLNFFFLSYSSGGKKSKI